MYGAADKSLFAEVDLMIAAQLIIYLLVFTLMVKIAVKDNALNGIYFYPREVRKRAVEIGLPPLVRPIGRCCCFLRL